MAFDYAEIADVATELLTEFGQTITRRTVSNGAMNLSTGVVTSTTADVSRIGVAFPVKSGITTLRGNLVQAADIELMLDPGGAVEISDRYIVASQEFSVVSYERLAPAGVSVLYTLHLRAA